MPCVCTCCCTVAQWSYLYIVVYMGVDTYTSVCLDIHYNRRESICRISDNCRRSSEAERQNGFRLCCWCCRRQTCCCPHCIALRRIATQCIATDGRTDWLTDWLWVKGRIGRDLWPTVNKSEPSATTAAAAEPQNMRWKTMHKQTARRASQRSSEQEEVLYLLQYANNRWYDVLIFVFVLLCCGLCCIGAVNGSSLTSRF